MSVKDTTNDLYEVLELGCIKQGTDQQDVFVEYANVGTGGSIGKVGIATSGRTALNIT